MSSDIIVLLILFSFSGFFSSAEAALLSLSDLHLHKMKSDNYPFLSSVLKLLAKPRRLLITIVTSNEAVNISISILAAALFIHLFGEKGQVISIVVTSLVLFLVGEAIPKTFGVTYPMQISSAVAPLLLLISRLEFPIVATLEKAPGLILKRLDQRKNRDTDVLMEDEFKHLIDAGSREGVVDETQRELITTIFESGDRPVTDIMIPRVEMFCLSSDMTAADIIREVAGKRYERVPVYREDRDDIIGILFARDLLHAALGSGSLSFETLLARPYFVPESKTINGLLHDFQEKSIQIAIVVDEYGGVSGLVTLEDILEHLFEEAYGDDDPAANCGCDILDENTMIVPGKMPMEQVNDLLSASLPQDEFDTIGGFVLHLFGKMPERSEITSFQNYSFRVESVGRTRILKIRIEKEKQTTPEEDE